MIMVRKSIRQKRTKLDISLSFRYIQLEKYWRDCSNWNKSDTSYNRVGAVNLQYVPRKYFIDLKLCLIHATVTELLRSSILTTTS